jgi:hypothetical protein
MAPPRTDKTALLVSALAHHAEDGGLQQVNAIEPISA